MAYKIEKTKTEKEIIDFKAEYLQDCLQQGYNLVFAEDKDYIYALSANEILKDGKIVINPNYQAELAEREAIRVANLKMTPRDFIIGLEGLGVKFETIEGLLAQNPQARKELNYCQFVYRGNTLLDTLCGTFGITPVQLNELFKTKGQ